MTSPQGGRGTRPYLLYVCLCLPPLHFCTCLSSVLRTLYSVILFGPPLANHTPANQSPRGLQPRSLLHLCTGALLRFAPLHLPLFRTLNSVLCNLLCLRPAPTCFVIHLSTFPPASGRFAPLHLPLLRPPHSVLCNLPCPHLCTASCFSSPPRPLTSSARTAPVSKSSAGRLPPPRFQGVMGFFI